MTAVQIIGGGKMGEALLAGVLAAGWASAERIRVVEADPARREELYRRYPGVEMATVAAEAEGTVVAVKPGDVSDVVGAVVAAGGGRILSIAAGVTLAVLEAAAGPGVAVVRAMPNTPALVGRGAAAIAAGSWAGPADLDWADRLLSSVGIVERVPEQFIDAVTGVSGSGPAYLFLLAEAMIDAGVLVGLSRPMAERLVAQTLLGSATLLANSGGEDAGTLRAAVTSPGGTTAAALRELERGGMRAAVLDAVVAARDRAGELA